MDNWETKGDNEFHEVILKLELFTILEDFISSSTGLVKLRENLISMAIENFQF